MGTRLKLRAFSKIFVILVRIRAKAVLSRYGSRRGPYKDDKELQAGARVKDRCLPPLTGPAAYGQLTRLILGLTGAKELITTLIFHLTAAIFGLTVAKELLTAAIFLLTVPILQLTMPILQLTSSISLLTSSILQLTIKFALC